MLKHVKLMVILALVFCLGVSALLTAATTGKISGKVTDVSSGEPLAGVNVIIAGTSMGGATDIDGDYFIINVPPGTYTVEARMIGYTTLAKSGVNVNVDRTITVDFTLTQTVLEGQEVTVVAEREIVPMDVSASHVVASVEEMTEIPFVQDIGEFLNLQVGVENDMIRGGGLDQTEFMMDGLMVVDNRTNQPLMMVNLSAVQEINIIKGGFNAEYGNVRSGLINVVTKEGGQNYFGSVDFRFSPARYKHEGYNIYDPRNFYLRPYLDPAVCWVGTANGTWSQEYQEENITFGGWNAVSAATLATDDPTDDKTPEEARDRFIWQHRSQAYDDWNVPGANDLLAKYGSSLAAYEAATGRSSHEDPYGDKPEWNTDVSLGGPIPFVGKYLGDLNFFASYRINKETYTFPTSRDYSTEQSTQIKLISRLSSSMKLTLEGLYGATAGADGGGFGRGAYWPAYYAKWNRYSSMIGFSFDHVLSPSTFYNVRISTIESATVNDGWESHEVRDLTTLITFGADEEDEIPYNYGIQYGAIEDQFLMSGEGSTNKDHSRVSTLNVKLDLTSQMDKYNQFKTGFEFNYDDLSTSTARDIPCQPDLYNSVKWTHFPYRLGAYLQDKLEFEGMIANLGMRLDYNNPNCDWYTVDPFSDYFKASYASVFQSDAPKEPAKGQFKISPRLGISHPISEDAKLYFNYGHFYSMPSSNDMYRISYGRPGVAGVTGIGNPSAYLEKTVAYELGVEYNIGNMFLLHLAGYYKDVTDQTGSIRFQNYDGSVSYSTFRNTNYEDIRGFELRFEKRWGDWITGWVNYDYMVSTSGDTGRATYYDDYFRNLLEGLQDPDVERPLPRPSLRANVMVRTPNDLGPAIGGIHPLGDISVSFLLTWRAGSYMTWDPLNTLELENNLQWKGARYIDIRINKRLRVGRFNFEFFADINNALNDKYISTGGFRDNDDRDDYYRSLHLPMYEEQAYQDAGLTAGDDKLGDVKSDDKPYINMPNINFLTFMNPRSVTLGFRFNF
ncbi:TonB-dependent receptor [bacterium]|nr:TonB-dependent receptor [bacterium]